jgi:RNA polymerase sigma-70 factor (ECF subfamily)
MLASRRDSEREVEARVLDLARRGERARACELLVEAFGRELIGTCTARLGDQASGEDAAQDTLARALVALADFRGDGGLRPWLHRIAANRCVDLLRRRQVQRSRELSEADLGELPAPAEAAPGEALEEAATLRRRALTLRSMLRELKEPDRTWLELHYVSGVSYDDLAVDAGTSRTAVKQRIWRAVKQMRALLGGIEGDLA